MATVSAAFENGRPHTGSIINMWHSPGFEWVSSATPRVETALQVPNILAATVCNQLRHTGA
jgi:hypothetical protein